MEALNTIGKDMIQTITKYAKRDKKITIKEMV